MKTTRLALATAGVPLVVLAAVYLLQLAWAGRLPDTVVSHWGTSGPDRGTDLTAMTGWTLGIGVVIAAVSAVAILVSHHRSQAVPRSAVGFTAWLATLPGGILAGSMWASLDVPAWEQSAGAVGAVAIAFGVSLLAGGGSAWLAGPAPTRPAPQQVADLPSAGLEAGERAAWIGSGTNYPMAFGGALVIGLFLVLQVTLTGLDVMPYALVLVVAVLALSAVCRVRVRVDSTGATLSLGLFKFPTRHLTLDEIESADVDHMSVWSAGGYGLRRGPAYTAFKVRAGETLSIRLTSGHTVKATVDQAEQAAGLVNDLVAARR